jgi:hypothetical protein
MEEPAANVAKVGCFAAHVRVQPMRPSLDLCFHGKSGFAVEHFPAIVFNGRFNF